MLYQLSYYRIALQAAVVLLGFLYAYHAVNGLAVACGANIFYGYLIVNRPVVEHVAVVAVKFGVGELHSTVGSYLEEYAVHGAIHNLASDANSVVGSAIGCRYLGVYG